LRWRGFLLGRRGFTNIRQVRSEPRFSDQGRSIEDVIARRTATVAPPWTWAWSCPSLKIDIGGGVIGANLLAVAVKTTVRYVNASAALGHSRSWHRINVGALFVALRFEMSNLQIRNVSEPEPGKGERREESDNEWGEALHQCTTVSPGSGFTGFKNVGTLDVRPRPRSMRRK
jgi:hypothetical protein